MQEIQEMLVRSLGHEISPGGGSGNPLQYFCWENPRGRGAWLALVCGVAELDMTELLGTHTWHIIKATQQTGICIQVKLE